MAQKLRIRLKPHVFDLKSFPIGFRFPINTLKRIFVSLVGADEKHNILILPKKFPLDGNEM